MKRILVCLFCFLSCLACRQERPRRLLVTTEAMQAGQRIDPAQFEARPAKDAAGIRWVEEADAALIQGRLLRVDLPAGSPLAWSVLASAPGELPVAGRVPDGLFALDVWVRGGAWVAPRDFVDVLISFYHPERGERVSHLMLQDVPVLALGPSVELSQEPAVFGPTALMERIEERRLTLLLHPAEAPLLFLAYGLGPIYVSLRHPDDRSLADSTDRITVERLIEQAKQPRPPVEIPGLRPPEVIDAPGPSR
ncbi:MAG: hypothetical protein JRF33_22260 [Deltaproteobacteria bacterium]|nr:hypothetical protein [Deltaproteobacteria bacterium]